MFLGHMEAQNLFSRGTNLISTSFMSFEYRNERVLEAKDRCGGSFCLPRQPPPPLLLPPVLHGEIAPGVCAMAAASWI